MLQILYRLQQENPHNPLIFYNLACYYASEGGSTKKAIFYLKKAVKHGYRNFAHIQQDKDLKSIHNEPEFQKLVQK